MADIADVLNELASIIANAVYPNGTTQPSLSNSPVLIYPGWPSSDNLDKDLAAGTTHVTVFPKDVERNTTRYSKRQSHVTKAAVTTLTLSVAYSNAGHLQLEGGGNLLLEDGSSLLIDGNSLAASIAGNIALDGGGNLLLEDGSNFKLNVPPAQAGVAMVVTVGGTVSAPQNVMLRVNGKSYVYGVQTSDTLDTIASALAGLVAVDVSGTVAIGPAVNLGLGGRLTAARVGGVGTATRETRRQERLIMITVWSGTPDLRNQIASAIDGVLADIEFIPMPDGFAARLTYQNSPLIDSLQKAALYRRDLNYKVEYATTASEQAAQVIAPSMTINDQLTITI